MPNGWTGRQSYAAIASEFLHDDSTVVVTRDDVDTMPLYDLLDVLRLWCRAHHTPSPRAVELRDRCARARTSHAARQYRAGGLRRPTVMEWTRGPRSTGRSITPAVALAVAEEIVMTGGCTRIHGMHGPATDWSGRGGTPYSGSGTQLSVARPGALQLRTDSAGAVAGNWVEVTRRLSVIARGVASEG
jgi:hypothetical protein